MAKNLKRTFHEFVELVKPIPQVKHVVAFPEEGGEIFTYIERMDEQVELAVIAAQIAMMEGWHEDEAVDFRTIYMNDRALSDFVRPLPALHFSRE